MSAVIEVVNLSKAFGTKANPKVVLKNVCTACRR